MTDLERIMQEHADRAINAVRSLMEPPLGLGDYEPFDLSDDDLVWACAPGTGNGMCDFSKPIYRWPSAADVTNANPGATPDTTTLRASKAMARRHGFAGVQLVDGNMNVLKEWPV